MLDTAAVMDQTQVEEGHGAEATDTGCCFVHNARGSPFVVSGEIFLRSSQKLLFGSSTTGSAASSTDNQPDDRRDPVASPTPGRSGRSGKSKISSQSANGGGSCAGGHPSAGLLAGLPQNLCNLLLCHPDFTATERPSCTSGSAEAGPSPPRGLGRLVAGARIERRSVRRKRVEYLKSSKIMARCLATSQLTAVQKAADGFREGCSHGRARLNTRLGRLVLRFADATSAEMAAEDAQTAAEREHCRRETERLELAARLASLAATVEHRTRGSVVLRRLPPTHPQHARCLRAATENVRPGFFSKKSPYGAVEVLDIYKIENRILLERFQRAAEARDPRKVKGLFCHVPGECLEHTVLYGMGDAATIMGGGGASARVPSNAGTHTGRSRCYSGEDPIDLFFGEMSINNISTRGGRGGDYTTTDAHSTRARGNAAGRKPLEFPRAFSRHSTLEEEREYANTNRARDGGEGGAPCRTSRPLYGGDWSEPQASSPPADSGTLLGQRRRRRHHASGEGSAAGIWQQGLRVSGLRFLALCRVMIGSMHVVSAEVPAATAAAERTDNGHGGTDIMPSRDTSSPPRSTNPAPSKQQSGPPSTAENHREQYSLPLPPPGQADFDAIYFPFDEEYRLLNEDHVLPEFLVIHRFVSVAPSNGSTKTDSNSYGRCSTPSKAKNITDTRAVGISDGGGGCGETGSRKFVARGRDHDGEQRHRQDGCSRQSWEDIERVRESPSVSALATRQDAMSVVAGIEAAIGCFSSPQLLPCTTCNGCDGENATPRKETAVALSQTSIGHEVSCSQLSPDHDDRDRAQAVSLQVDPDDGSANNGAVDVDDCRGRERVRGSGRPNRVAIVRDVESELELYWQEMCQLRELEKDEVTRLVLSRKKLRQPT